MTLADYITDMDRRRNLAADTGASAAYLWQIATGWRGKKPSRMLALAIERETNGAVTRYELRPDLFGQTPSPVAA